MTIKAVTGRDKICLEIVEAFGIKHCRSLQINMRFDEIVTIKAEFFPEINGIKQLLPIFEEYELVKKENNAKRKK